MKTQVNPTRLELSKMKKRLAVAVRGQKLLKDKQNELVRSLLSKAKENAALRMDVEEYLHKAMELFSHAGLSIADAFLEEGFFCQQGESGVDIDTNVVLNVEIPHIYNKSRSAEHSEEELRYGYLNSSAELDEAMEYYEAVFSKLLSLSEIEKACQLLSIEIEKTRRRVNALEYRTIPELEEGVKEIQMKLEENERANITRLIKMKSFT